jgi:ABC-type phosphate transport system permease subunit
VTPLVISIIFGLFGNFFYMKHINKLIKQKNALHPSLHQGFTKDKRGVSVGAMIGMIIIHCVLAPILCFLWWMTFRFR